MIVCLCACVCSCYVCHVIVFVLLFSSVLCDCFFVVRVRFVCVACLCLFLLFGLCWFVFVPFLFHYKCFVVLFCCVCDFLLVIELRLCLCLRVLFVLLLCFLLGGMFCFCV